MVLLPHSSKKEYYWVKSFFRLPIGYCSFKKKRQLLGPHTHTTFEEDTLVVMIRWVLFLFAVAAVIHPMARALRSQTDRSIQFQADEAVEVFCDSKWWQSRVVASVDTGLTVAYAEGGKETIETHDLAERVRRYETGGISVHSRVQANFEDGGVYFEGAISSVNGNGTFDI